LVRHEQPFSGQRDTDISRYAFPPLATTIKKDLKLTQNDWANSNIAALCGTLVVRFIAGPLCDLFGPRYTFVCILLAGAIPTAMAGLITNVSGLLALRFFVGILGGTFVPCQVWSMGFFDKNVVGTSNALIGGWGNSGGGITYFIMPIIYDSLRLDHHMSSHKAWRVAFIVPFILIVATAFGMVFFCQDTPTGKWADRHQHTQELLDAQIVSLDTGSMIADPRTKSFVNEDQKDEKHTTTTSPAIDIARGDMSDISDQEADSSRHAALDAARAETIVAPTMKEALKVIFSQQTLFHCATYMCSFGG